ncbi:fatty acid hydroxylase family protein [Tsuneonella suprasediminis]|uniref:Fatty acid hydroxylase family protein n=1 Tax=Tsuneonella suprasediminis TaxID=2306996 RepID=A0A419QYC5_9SPHN|nr:sterol desaturase family protein [Tsuneonella suprasediminis]RJX65683.1 fatty acid hydroxylase family protein [Tsuneonella suprasediminis]
MPASSIAIIGIYFGFAILELFRTNLFVKAEQTRDDGIVEVLSMVILLAITQPAIVLGTAALANWLVPQWAGALANLNVFAAILLFLVCDDLTQYWWHRLSHSYHWLYNLHRAHHNGRYMSVRLTYRNNIIYYAMMPGIWLSGFLVFLGLGWVYAGYIVVKMLVIIGAHSDVAWDRPLYRIKWLSPVMWLVERTISTPATHHAHHGRHADDPAVNYKGNYGNLLFFWDILFGTAKITRTYPQSYGVEGLAPATLGQQLLWPVFPENKAFPEDEDAVAAPLEQEGAAA